MASIRFNMSKVESRWLSSMFPSPIMMKVDGEKILFPTVEHWYTWNKCSRSIFRQKVLEAWDGKTARHWGQENRGFKKLKIENPDKKFRLVEGWDDGKKDEVMWDGQLAKFTQIPILKKLLLDTGDTKLIHDATWDEYWGSGRNNDGKDKLGKMIMKIRDKLAQE